MQDIRVPGLGGEGATSKVLCVGATANAQRVTGLGRHGKTPTLLLRHLANLVCPGGRQSNRLVNQPINRAHRLAGLGARPIAAQATSRRAKIVSGRGLG